MEHIKVGHVRIHLAGERRAKGRAITIEALGGETHDPPRLGSGLAEFDRVSGGGFVRGSVLLLGGDPGIGKSTVLVQVEPHYARSGKRALFISGEEAVAQVHLRPNDWGWRTRPCDLPPRPRLRTSWRPCARARHPTS